MQFKSSRPFTVADVDESDIEYIQIEPVALGFWRHIQNTPSSGSIIKLQVINLSGPLGWWHHTHGITHSDKSRGQKVRIGVIDLCLEMDESLQHINYLGQVDQSGHLRKINMAEHPHGRYCCSLIANRLTSEGGFEGISPGADVFFVGAMDEHDPTSLDPLRVANAITILSKEFNCDIINLSAGELTKRPEFLLRVILQARDVGTTIVVAGGNSAKTLRYPAAFDEVVTVVALGKKNTSPPMTPGHEYESSAAAKMIDENHYYWPNNDYGTNVNYIAAGAGIIDTLDETPNVDIYGTSYASPILCGLLAAKLSKNHSYHGCRRDISRVKLALAELESMSTQLKIGEKMHFGIPVL